MNRSKLTIRFVAGPYGGWTTCCPACAAVTVRDSFRQAVFSADKHIRIHQRGPFAVTPQLEGNVIPWTAYRKSLSTTP